MPLPIRNSRIKLSQGQIFWREVGHGPALVFLHGSWEESSQWLPLVTELGHQYHCFAPDLLGFGESKTEVKLHYSIELEVEALAEYLEFLKLRQVYLVGHSLGAWIATSYALRFPEQVQGLILLAPEGLQMKQLGNRWQTARWLLLPLTGWLLRSLQSLKRWWRIGWVERGLEQRRRFLAARVACQLLFQRRRSEIQAESLQERLAWLQVPALVLQGQQDHSATEVLAQVYVQQAPEGKLRVIPEAGADLLQFHAASVAQEIEEFCQQERSYSRLKD